MQILKDALKTTKYLEQKYNVCYYKLFLLCYIDKIGDFEGNRYLVYCRLSDTETILINVNDLVSLRPSYHNLNRTKKYVVGKRKALKPVDLHHLGMLKVCKKMFNMNVVDYLIFEIELHH